MLKVSKEIFNTYVHKRFGIKRRNMFITFAFILE